MPDFQRFAEECREEVSALRRAYQMSGNIASFPTMRLLEQAERHARLLQAVWEWANTLDGFEECGFCEVEWHGKPRDDSPEHAEGCPKAHVRALLQPTEEKAR